MRFQAVERVLVKKKPHNCDFETAPLVAERETITEHRTPGEAMIAEGAS
jgi:hypothetical protein